MKSSREIIAKAELIKDSAQAAIKMIDKILDSQNQDSICRYGEHNLTLQKVIFSNMIKSVNKILIEKKPILATYITS